MYTKKFFMAALIFLFIVASLVVLSDDNVDRITKYGTNEPIFFCAWRVITEIVSGKLVVSEDGKYLHYKEVLNE